LEYLDEPGYGRVRVVDYKTGKVFSKKSTKAQKEALERQIRFYHLLLDGYKGGDITIAEAILDFVEPTDDGVFEQKRLSVDQDDIAALEEEIAGMVASVCDGTFLQQGCQTNDCEACALWNAIRQS
jgi:RecB family exonuclease